MKRVARGAGWREFHYELPWAAAPEQLVIAAGRLHIRPGPAAPAQPAGDGGAQRTVTTHFAPAACGPVVPCGTEERLGHAAEFLDLPLGLYEEILGARLPLPTMQQAREPPHSTRPHSAAACACLPCPPTWLPADLALRRGSLLAWHPADLALC